MNYLKYVDPEKWIWIIDCNGFEWKHACEVKTAIGIGTIVNDFGRIKNIIFINSNYLLEQMIRMIRSCLSDIYYDTIIIIKKENMLMLFQSELNKLNIGYENALTLFNQSM
jgi:hypothetical protein